MSDQTPQYSDLTVLKRIIALARPYRGLFVIAMILAGVLAPLSSLRPKLVNVIIDDYIIPSDADGLIRMSLVLIGILFLEVILRYWFIYSTNFIGQNVIRDLRDRVFRHIVSLKMRYFDTTPIGTSTTRTINDIESINSVFSEGLMSIIADLLTIFVVLYMMSTSSWRLTLICLVTMPLMILATYIFKEKVKVSYQKVRNQISQMNAFLHERISGMNVIKIFNLQDQQKENFKEINRRYTRANLDSIFYYALFYPAVEIISALTLALMVWWGAPGVLDGNVSFGALVAFPLYVSLLFRPLRQLADKFNTLQMGMVAGERVFRLLDRDEKIPNNGTLTRDKLKGDIDFTNVSFSYDGENEVIKELTMSIPAGDTLAIVGSTGSGKTTLINLLNRFYDYQKGDIKVDGERITDYELKNYRQKIGTVLQDVFLFTGSVFDNLSLNDPSVTREEVMNAARMIDADEMIRNLPGGYDFQISERGSNLSLGQRQMLSFVRFIIFDPDIMILDEATSSIDPETESRIQYAIEKLIEKRTSIIIAHRLSTIQHADSIAVMSDGRLVEFGSHDDLIEKEGGYYRSLYEHQFQVAT